MTGHHGRDHHSRVTEDVVDHVQYIGAHCRLAQNIRVHAVGCTHDHGHSQGQGVGIAGIRMPST